MISLKSFLFSEQDSNKCHHVWNGRARKNKFPPIHRPAHGKHFSTVSLCKSIPSVTYVFKLSGAITLKGFCKRSRSSVQSARLGSQYVALRGHRHVTRPSNNWLYVQSDSQFMVETFNVISCQSLFSKVIRSFNLMVNLLSAIPHSFFTLDKIVNKSW